MNKQTEALKLALEALEELTDTEQTYGALERGDTAITALREALAEQPAPVVNVQHKPTTYTERFTHAVAVLCGAQPPAEMIAEWFEDVEVNGGHRLQGWVGAQRATPSWVQCIVVLDAAHVLANDPEEGEGHETVKPSEQPAQQEPFGYFKAEPFGWTDCAETDDGAIALYTTPQAQPAPVQGWKLVPAQPTDQMRDAGNVIIGDRGALFAAYQAMLAAAPQAQPAQQECRCNQGQVCHVCDPITKGNT